MSVDSAKIFPPDPSTLEDAQSGYGQMKPGNIDPSYVYQCRYCDTIFHGDNLTGAGNMGRSFGTDVVCPRCGSNNVDGPRHIQPGEVLYPETSFMLSQPPGLDIFSNSSAVEAAQQVEQV